MKVYIDIDEYEGVEVDLKVKMSKYYPATIYEPPEYSQVENFYILNEEEILSEYDITKKELYDSVYWWCVENLE